MGRGKNKIIYGANMYLPGFPSLEWDTAHMKSTYSERLHTDRYVNYKSLFEEKEVRTATIIKYRGLT